MNIRSAAGERGQGRRGGSQWWRATSGVREMNSGERYCRHENAADVRGDIRFKSCEQRLRVVALSYVHARDVIDDRIRVMRTEAGVQDAVRQAATMPQNRLRKKVCSTGKGEEVAVGMAVATATHRCAPVASQ